MKTKLTQLKVQSSKLKRSSNEQFTKTRGALARRFGAWSLVFLLSFSARAELPAPDNLLYGTIVLGSQPIGASNTSVFVEARRTVNGPAIASYRMGSSAQAGGFYLLKIPLEELAPLDNASNSLAGQSLFLTVRDPSGVRAQLPYTIPERGHATRVDFGTALPDSDNDGLPDAWELAYFGNLGQNGNGDPDGDGCNNLCEFINGTNPNDPNNVSKLTITFVGTNKIVSFFAFRAEGLGYEGYDRIYSLEYTTNLGAGPWLGVFNRTNILGNNMTNVTIARESDSAAFYRTKASLSRP